MDARCLIFAAVGLAAVSLGGGAHAADDARTIELPKESIAPTERLVDRGQARYLLRQVALTTEQAKAAKSLLDEFFSDEPQPALDLEQLRAAANAFEDAKKANDQEAIRAARTRLEQLAGGRDAQVRAYLSRVRRDFSDAQRKQLAAAQERLRRNPTGAVRPIDVFRVAQALELTGDQRRELLAARRSVRERVERMSTLEPAERVEIVNGLLARIAGMLDQAQRGAFAASVHRLRPDLAGEELGGSD